MPKGGGRSFRACWREIDPATRKRTFGRVLTIDTAINGLTSQGRARALKTHKEVWKGIDEVKTSYSRHIGASDSVAKFRHCLPADFAISYHPNGR